MTDKVKKWLFWVGIFPVIVAAWTTISATVYHIDVLVRIVELAAEKDQYGKNGLDKYLIMYSQHQALWESYVNEVVLE